MDAATVKAMCATAVIIVQSSEFQRMLVASPEMAWEFFETLKCFSDAGLAYRDSKVKTFNLLDN